MAVHLGVAGGRGYLTPHERDDLRERYARIGKGLTRWIQYLERQHDDEQRSIADRDIGG